MDIQTLTGIVIVGHIIYASVLTYYYVSMKNTKRNFAATIDEYKRREATYQLREAYDQVTIKGLEYCLNCAEQRAKMFESKYQLLAYFEETNLDHEETQTEEVEAEE